MHSINWYNTCLLPGMRACLTFYRTLALPLITISLICAFQVLQSRSVYFILFVLWVKILTTVVIGGFIALFRSEQFIFFNNLGYSRTRLLAVAFALDFSIWILFMVITVQLI